MGSLLRSTTLGVVWLCSGCLGPIPGFGDLDRDHDGWSRQVDCDDLDPAVFPGQQDDAYDGVDANCDGWDDWDQDRDGFPAKGAPTLAEGQDHDCDDTDPSRFPGAPEDPYDGVDSDCEVGKEPDIDEDGFKAIELGGDDCNDADPYTHPDADETWYDGVDQDCDGRSDYDADGDGRDHEDYGGDDCDDTDALLPSSWWLDEDGDGVGGSIKVLVCVPDANMVKTKGDCDDTDASIWPGAAETWYDGVDQDCDGASDYDADGDGLDHDAYGGPDCDDTDPALPARWYTDADGDGVGDAYFGLACEAPAGTSTVTSDCDDSDPATYPGASEICSNGVDNNCDGKPTGCEIKDWRSYSVELDQSAAGMEEGDRLGFALAGGGDLDGDGLDELAAGAYLDDTLATNAGAVHIWYGKSRRSDMTPDAVLWGEQSQGRLGRAVAMGADLSGDGFDDLVVAAPYDSSLASSGGAVWLVSGVPVVDQAISDVGVVVQGDVAGGRLGESLDVGDLDGDGQADLWVGAPQTDEERGAVYWFAGPITQDLLLSEADGATTGDEVGARLGDQVLAPGDLTGDGHPDALLTAPGATSHGGLSGAGRLVLLAGPLVGDPDPSSAQLVVDGDLEGSSLGVSLAVWEDTAGTAWIAVGSTVDRSVWLVEGGLTGTWSGRDTLAIGYGMRNFGQTLASCDSEGLGVDFLFIGAPQDWGSGKSGTVFGYNLGASRYYPSAYLTASTADSEGAALACAGNFNGDTAEDLAVGAPARDNERGAVDLFFGEGL